MLKFLPDLHWTTASWRSQVFKASACVVYVPVTYKFTSSLTELNVYSAYADLKELRPVSGFVKEQAAPVVQPQKPAASLALVNKTAVNTDSEGSPQPLQQVQQSAPAEYEMNSLAIKLSNNPLSSLAGLQEAVGTVLDKPVRLTAFARQIIFLLKANAICLAVTVAATFLAQSRPCLVLVPPSNAVQDNDYIMHGVQAELRWLDLSQCKLTSIQDELTRFPKLQMLYLHANQISKLSEVKKLGKLSGLQKLTLHGNPIAELPHYK